MALLNWVDAMGVGAFCCIGAQAGVRKVRCNLIGRRFSFLVKFCPGHFLQD